MALHMDDTEGLDDEAPQPIDAESVANGSFERISKDQGARSASHALHDVRICSRYFSPCFPCISLSYRAINHNILLSST